MYHENNIENQFYLHVMNFFTRGSSWKKFKNTCLATSYSIIGNYIDCNLTDKQKNLIVFQALLSSL